MTPYAALWRTSLPGTGVEYRQVTVISEPVFGHVKLENKMAIPVAELVGVEGDSYAVITPGGKAWLAGSAVFNDGLANGGSVQAGKIKVTL